jgi:ABC-type uncharacterized transport system substrate-binding protein
VDKSERLDAMARWMWDARQQGLPYSNPPGALIVATDPFFSIQRARLAALARQYAVPAIYDRREFVEAGGLISYGHHRADAYHQLGIYTGRILKGEKPADLPVVPIVNQIRTY